MSQYNDSRESSDLFHVSKMFTDKDLNKVAEFSSHDTKHLVCPHRDGSRIEYSESHDTH